MRVMRHSGKGEMRLTTEMGKRAADFRDTGLDWDKPPQSVVWGSLWRLQGLAKKLPGYSPLMQALPALL